MEENKNNILNALSLKIIFFKKKHGYTNETIAKKANLPVTTISRIVSGGTKAPKLSTLKKIAAAFDCTLDELTEENNIYYLNKETADMAQELNDNRELRAIFDATKNLKPDELKTIADMIKMVKKE